MEPEQTTSKNNIMLPIAIVIAGVLIAGALFVTKKDGTTNSAGTFAGSQAVAGLRPENNAAPVGASDHILGSPNAPVMIVEYSDTDCPYCKSFHPILQRIINEFGQDGKVAWVYRHFAFHPNAPKEAEATECAAELGGNTKFWQYLDLLLSKKDFNVTPYKGTDPSQLPVLAAQIGIDKAAFTECLSSGKYASKITDSYNDAIKSGAQGTPHTIIMTKNGRIAINGVVQFEQLKAAVQSLLNEKPQ